MSKKNSKGKRVVMYEEQEETDTENVPVINSSNTDLADIIEEHNFERDQEEDSQIQKSTYKLDDSSDEEDKNEDEEDEEGLDVDFVNPLTTPQIVDDGLDV